MSKMGTDDAELCAGGLGLTGLSGARVAFLCSCGI